MSWQPVVLATHTLEVRFPPPEMLVTMALEAHRAGREMRTPEVIDRTVRKHGASVVAARRLGLPSIRVLRKIVGTDGPPLGMPIGGTAEQLTMVRMLVLRLRELFSDPGLSEGRALELAAVEMMNGPIGWPGTHVSLELVSALELDPSVRAIAESQMKHSRAAQAHERSP